MKNEFNHYPKYRQMYVHAFDRMVERRKERGIATNKWENGEDVMKWWIGDDPYQMEIQFLEEE